MSEFALILILVGGGAAVAMVTEHMVRHSHGSDFGGVCLWCFTLCGYGGAALFIYNLFFGV